MSKTMIIAEIGINHNGSVELAKKLIDVAVDAGCDAVKFQKRTLDLVYTQEELDKPRESPWGTTNREQKQGLELTKSDYEQIDAYCRKRDIAWFASCWDVESVNFINQFDVPYHKVASALLTNDELLTAMRDSGKSVILSTGMSTIHEVQHAARMLGTSLDTVMHCTSTYPTQPDEMNLNVVRDMTTPVGEYRGQMVGDGWTYRIPWDVRVGFSNHYSGIIWSPIVSALGAEVIEFHITLDRTMYGSDQAASIEPDGVKKLAEQFRLTKQMLGDGQKRVYASEVPVKEKLRR